MTAPLTLPRTWEDDVLAVDMSGLEKGDCEYHPIRDRIVTARRAGRCDLCTQAIAPGTRIRSLTDRLDGAISTRRFCHTCCAAMAAVWTDDGEALEARYALGMERVR